MEWCGIVQLGILVFQIIEHDAIGSAEGVDVRLPYWRAGELHMGACAIGAYIQPLLLQHGMCLHAPVLVAGTHHRMAQPHHRTTHHNPPPPSPPTPSTPTASQLAQPNPTQLRSWIQTGVCVTEWACDAFWRREWVSEGKSRQDWQEVQECM